MKKYDNTSWINNSKKVDECEKILQSKLKDKYFTRFQQSYV